MQINVGVDVKQFTRQLNKIQRKQIPFAAAKALTLTAKDATKQLGVDVEKDLHKPVGFTKRGFGFKGANKKNLTALVFAKDLQAKYLKYAVYGGTRRPKGKTEAVPVAIKLNASGNIPGRHRGKIAALLKRPDTFSGMVKGIAGIWKRSKDGRAVRLLIAYEPNVKYKKRFHFNRSVQRTVSREFVKHMDTTLRQALASAR